MIEKYLGVSHLEKLFSTEISKLISNTIGEHLEELYCCNISDDQAYDELQSIVPSVMDWLKRCSSKNFTLELSPALLRRTSSQGICETTWNELLSSEEMITCPTLGIRGQIDLVVLGNVSSYPDKKFFLPVELKTGRWRLESLPGHRAQIILYVLMIILREHLSWRLFSPQCVGILLYIGSKEVENKWEVISPSWGEIRALIQARNSLAYFMKNEFSSVTNSFHFYFIHRRPLLPYPKCLETGVVKVVIMLPSV